ncbi:MAG TPA: CotS family spore coat protein [Bacillales bacterium]|nr:CotS family spore coat protein [Bacillales bacterium]
MLIGPWLEEELLRGDTGEEFYVPDYIIKMAEDVLKHYNLSVKSMTCITTKSDKGGAIWKLETDAGPKSLKLLHRRPTRSMFSLGAQEYLVDVQKANVPPLVKTKDGENYLVMGGKCWFVAEWIEPLYPVTKDLEGAKHLCRALGEFHRLSQGYVPPAKSELPSRLYKWPKNYQKVIDKMDWFRNLAKAYSEMPASSLLLSVVDQFEEQAKRGLEVLTQSSYNELTKLGNEAWGLVHQDYGWSNGQMGEKGMWVIDLDGVAYDIPIRDLRKLITGTMADLYTWDVTWVREMIKAYHEANPISKELYEILMIDLAMPSEFYKNVKEVVYEPEVFLNEETAAMINTIVETDKTKWPVLEQIKNDWGKVEKTKESRSKEESKQVKQEKQEGRNMDKRNNEDSKSKKDEKKNDKKDGKKKK